MAYKWSEKTNKLLLVPRNEKRFIARILATLCKDYNAAPPLQDPEMYPIMKEVFDKLEIPHEKIGKDKKTCPDAISPGNLVGKPDTESETGENWTEVIIKKFKEQGIALPHPQPALIMEGPEFLKKVRALLGPGKLEPLS